MPKRITAAQAAQMGLEPVPEAPQRRRITAAQAAELQLEPVEEESGSGAVAAGLVNALDSASLVGVPAVIAAKDAVLGIESAKASETTLDDDPQWESRGLVDRFRKNRDWLRAGMEREKEAHPVASFAGQLAPALIPGPGGVRTLKAMAGRGAVIGAAHGALGGDADTSGGDLEGTALQTAAGALMGAGGEVLGAGFGKLAKYAGEKAGRRLSSEISTRVKSLLGRYGQRKKDAVQAVKNLALQEGVEQMPQAVAGGKAAQIRQQLGASFPQAEADLFDASAENAAKQVRRFVGSQSRFGKSGIPDVPYAQKVAERTLTSQANRAIRDLAAAGLRIGLGSAVGSAVFPHLGLSSRESMALGGALAGGGRLWAIRKTAAAIMDHPKMLRAMAEKLPAFGERLARGGGNLGAVLGYLTAALATERGKQALLETGVELAQENGVEPTAFDGGADGGSSFEWEQPPADSGEEQLQPTEKMRRKGVQLIPTRVKPPPRRPTGGEL